MTKSVNEGGKTIYKDPGPVFSISSVSCMGKALYDATDHENYADRKRHRKEGNTLLSDQITTACYKQYSRYYCQYPHKDPPNLKINQLIILKKPLQVKKAERVFT